MSDGNLADMDAAGVRAMIGLAPRAVGQKQEEVFGAPEDFEDEAVTKRRIEVKFYETSRRKIGEEVSYYTDSDGVRQTQTTPIYESYTVELTDEMKPQTWGPGDFGDYVGYAPVMKLAPNVDDGRRAIFEAQGKGEMGRLMGDFYYYMLIESKGWSVANQPMYEKGIWDDRDTWLKAPTIRGVVDIGLKVAVGIATAGAGNAALGLIDDAVFGALDVASGHKTWQQAGLAFGQKALTAAASAGISGAFDGAQSVASGFQGVFENSLIGVTQGITNAFASSTINAFQINPDGSLGFSGDAFVGGLQSGLIGAATGMASSLTTGGINLGLGPSEQGFWEGAVNLAGSVASKGTSLGIHALMAGPGACFGDVWDASGGLSINVLDLGTMAGFMMGGVFKGALDTDAMNTRATVMGALSGTGLNINIGSKGITGSLGQGSDIGLMANVASLAQGLQTRAWALEEAQRQSIASGVSATSFYEGIGYAYSFGNAVGRGTLERLRTGYDELAFGADTAGSKAYTTADASGRRRIAMSSLDSGASFAVELAHEANRDGYQSADQRRETRNAVRDHTTMALALGRELGDSVFAGRQDIMRDMYAYMQTGGGAGFDQYADENYGNDRDYWKPLGFASLHTEGFEANPLNGKTDVDDQSTFTDEYLAYMAMEEQVTTIKNGNILQLPDQYLQDLTMSLVDPFTYGMALYGDSITKDTIDVNVFGFDLPTEGKEFVASLLSNGIITASEGISQAAKDMNLVQEGFSLLHRVTSGEFDGSYLGGAFKLDFGQFSNAFKLNPLDPTDNSSVFNVLSTVASRDQNEYKNWYASEQAKGQPSTFPTFSDDSPDMLLLYVEEKKLSGSNKFFEYGGNNNRGEFSLSFGGLNTAILISQFIKTNDVTQSILDSIKGTAFGIIFGIATSSFELGNAKFGAEWLFSSPEPYKLYSSFSSKAINTYFAQRFSFGLSSSWGLSAGFSFSTPSYQPALHFLYNRREE